MRCIECQSCVDDDDYIIIKVDEYDERVAVGTRKYMCKSCWDLCHEKCSNCGETFHENEFVYDVENDKHYCKECDLKNRQ